MKLIYLDTETTGVDCTRHAIIQIAGIVVAADGSEAEFNLEMQPFEGAAVERQALWKNKYSLEELSKFQTSATAFEKFDAIISAAVDRYDKQDKLYVVGYNSVFDVGFIREWYKRNGSEFYGSFFHNPPLDVMQLAAWAMVGKRFTLQDFRLVTVYEAVIGKPLEEAHDALVDIKATRELANELFKKMRHE